MPRALTANAQIHHRQYSAIAGRLAPQLLRTNVERRRERFDGLNRRLNSGLVANAQAHRVRLARHRDRVVAFGERAQRATRALLKQHRLQMERAGQLLAAFSYRGVLARGFALVRDGDGHPLRSAAAVAGGMRIGIEFSDGRVAATADGKRACAGKYRETRRQTARRRRFRRAGQFVRG